MGIPARWAEPTAFVARSLRRYTNHDGDWTCAAGWHEARVGIEAQYAPMDPNDRYTKVGDYWPHEDPRWPKVCGKGCGYEFKDEDRWQLFVNRVYVHTDDRSSKFTLAWGEVPVGTMYDAWWLPDGWVGDDGIHLTVQLPDNTPWTVDGPSSSCSERREEDGKVYVGHDTRTGHHCWTRTGDPKANPATVSATPSILSGNPETYHGFLTNGQLTSV